MVAVVAVPSAALAAPRVQPVPVPVEMRSNAFTVTVNGKPVDVAHAAADYFFASFDIRGSVDVAITAAEPGFWDKGVDIEPWRLGLRPKREGQTIRFKLAGPAKLSISRPRDFLNHAQMLFLFAGRPPAAPPQGAHVKVYAPGVYRESLNPKSGETLYLQPGAVFFGSLNLWKVEGVKVLGRGVIVYDGPQDPNHDEGWMQKPDWHCIGAMDARDVEISGLTCIVRSRTWSIQMKDSTGFTYDDLRVIGGNPGNANQDGMDWLGGGDTTVRDAFFRTSDDVFAMQGNWDGYSEEDLKRPGHDVANILIEHSELSTSISNIVRAGWPQKIYNSRNFTLRDSDVLHAGIGACGQTFGLFGFWGANGASGTHTSFTFQNIFLDNWYSLVQIEQENPSLQAFSFRNIWALDQPPLAGSTLAGDVRNVTFDNVKYGEVRATEPADVPVTTANGAEPAKFPEPTGPRAEFVVEPAVFKPGDKVTFTALPQKHTKYTWLFGDGTTGHGRKVRHRYKDAQGTELDGEHGAGRFRVLLRTQDEEGHEDWAARGVVAVAQWHPSVPVAGKMAQGLEWRIFPGAWTELPDLTKQRAASTGEAAGLEADAQGITRYATVWTGYINIPADGGYTFHLMARDGARLVIDQLEVAKTGPAFAQVCGSPGNAVRYARGSLGLRAGLHAFRLEGLTFASAGGPRLLWEGPGLPLGEVPTTAYRHTAEAALTR